MTLIKKANGYACEFRVKGIKPLHLSLRTSAKREAQQRHDAIQVLVRQRRVEMLDQLRTGILTVERVAAMVAHGEPLTPVSGAEVEAKTDPFGTVNDQIESYLKWLARNRSAGTHGAASDQLKRLQEDLGERAFSAVRSADINALQDKLVEKYSPNVVTTTMTRVGSLWRWVARQEHRMATEERRLPRAIYSPVDPETTSDETTRRERLLTADELKRLDAATPGPWKFALRCGYLAGLRQGEVLHLRPGLDVDLESSSINIRKQADWTPKTERSIRVVPMTPELADTAREHIERGWSSESWMFPSPAKAGRPISEVAYWRAFKDIVTRAGLVHGIADPQGISAHTLRHAFASYLVMADVDLVTVAELLGDAVDTVVSTYAHLSKDHKRQAVQRLAKALRITTTATTSADDTPSK